jgi:carboxyl-terminal processing protease
LSCLLLILFCTAARAEPFLPGGSYDQARVAQTTGAALEFMATRTLDPSSIPQLSIWGLRGLTTIDPKISTEMTGDSLRMYDDVRPIMIRPLPGEADAAGWGEAIGQMARGAWDASSVIRRAGTQAIVSNFFDEIFNHLDPYSRYAPPGEAQSDRARRRGAAGIGLQAAKSGSGFVVTGVLPDGPAAKAGVRNGESLLAIDGAALTDEDLATVGEIIAGPEHTSVELVLRDRGRNSRTIELERVLIPPVTVFATRVGPMLVLRVTGFSADTADRIAHEITAGLAGPRPPKGIAIDLRGNRGGLLRQAVEAAETLLPNGIVAVTQGRAPGSSNVFTADGHDLSGGLPVILVVDGRTASAAEILAAALSDQHRAVVVGSSTLGKGLVQTITSLPDGGELSVTWSRVLAPLGWPLQGLGVLPQICTSTGGDRTSREMTDLEHGTLAMSAALARHDATRAPISPGEVIDIRNACPAADGRDADLTMARFLIDHAGAYAAALKGPAADPQPVEARPAPQAATP